LYRRIRGKPGNGFSFPGPARKWASRSSNSQWQPAVTDAFSGSKSFAIEKWDKYLNHFIERWKQEALIQSKGYLRFEHVE
jgi:hypothetical protein